MSEKNAVIKKVQVLEKDLMCVCVCVSGPPGLRLEGADQQVATASGLEQGRYTFRLTVRDHQGATDSTSLIVRVQEG